MNLSDWHSEDIKAAIRKTGVSLAQLARNHALNPMAVNTTLLRSWPRVEAIVASHLNLRPQDIWPSRYDEAGNPIRGGFHLRQNHSPRRAGAQRQKRQSA